MAGGFKSVNLRLRQEFDLFANVRPAKTLREGQRYDNVDLVIVRENLEGYYAALERYEEKDATPRDRLLHRFEQPRRGAPHFAALPSTTPSRTAGAR